jgi:hypothetical protein
MLLIKMKYKEHGWLICGDLKVLCMLLGQEVSMFFMWMGQQSPESTLEIEAMTKQSQPNAR